jgi:hypothetical protein
MPKNVLFLNFSIVKLSDQKFSITWLGNQKI